LVVLSSTIFSFVLLTDLVDDRFGGQHHFFLIDLEGETDLALLDDLILLQEHSECIPLAPGLLSGHFQQFVVAHLLLDVGVEEVSVLIDLGAGPLHGVKFMLLDLQNLIQLLGFVLEHGDLLLELRDRVVIHQLPRRFVRFVLQEHQLLLHLHHVPLVCIDEVILVPPKHLLELRLDPLHVTNQLPLSHLVRLLVLIQPSHESILRIDPSFTLLGLLLL